MKRLALIIISILFISQVFYAQLENPYIRKGNRLYKKQRYAEAQVQYTKALKKDSTSFIAKNNLGLVYYKENNKKASLNVLAPLQGKKTALPYLPQAMYNLGVVYTSVAGDFLQANNIEEAIKYLTQAKKTFRNAIKINTDDYQARYNLWIVQHLLDSLQKQQNRQQNRQDNNKQNQNQQQKDKQHQNNQQNNKQKHNSQNGLSQETIARMLKAIEEQDKRLQQKMLKQLIKTKQKKEEKNW